MTAAVTALLIVGCGTQASADLFRVKRTGSIPGADLTLVVNDSGTVRCNNSPAKPLPDPLLLQARSLAEAIPADMNKPIPAIGIVNPTYHFAVTTGAGTAQWDVGIPSLPASFGQMVYFTRQVAKQVCGLKR